MLKEAEITRQTTETDIRLKIWPNGGGQGEIETGVGFFDHMLRTFSVHGNFGLTVICRGDLNVDCHHTVEDVGIALGQAFWEMTENKVGIARFGSQFLPMDEALVRAVVDLSGRPVFVFRGDLGQGRLGDFDVEMVREFFFAFAVHARVTLHLEVLYGENRHHMVEALFKATAHALRQATKPSDDATPAFGKVLSTKGTLI